jgi:hypothetical protein
MFLCVGVFSTVLYPGSWGAGEASNLASPLREHIRLGRRVHRDLQGSVGVIVLAVGCRIYLKTVCLLVRS